MFLKNINIKFNAWKCLGSVCWIFENIFNENKNKKQSNDKNNKNLFLYFQFKTENTMTKNIILSKFKNIEKVSQ